MPRDTQIDHIMVPAPITVDAEQSLAEVRRILANGSIHHLPVLQDGKLAGIISSNDILKLGLGDNIADEHPGIDKRLRATDIMQTKTVCISRRASVLEAARLLATGGFHALPVVDNERHLVGLTTSTDLINFLLEAAAPPAAPPAILNRLNLLEQVLEATQHYLRSGQGVIEHGRLQKALDAVARK